jgi:acetyl esterase/lipase
MTANPEMDIATLRAMLEALHERAAEPTDVTYREIDVADRPAMWAIPLAASDRHVILFLHGGGFVAGSMACHRKLAGHLAKAVGCGALVPEYRLAPEHPFPAQLIDLVAVYRWLLDRGYKPDQIAVAGDSSGGNLSTAICLKLKSEALPLPAAIIGMSPWYDMEAGGTSLDANSEQSALGSREMYLKLAGQYLNGHSATDPLANPLYADPAGLPPIYLTCGSSEALEDNAERFAGMARKAGVDVTLEVSEGMQHVYEFMAGRAAEADRTIANIGAWLRPKLGL